MEMRRGAAKADLKAKQDYRNDCAAEAERAAIVLAEANEQSSRLGAEVAEKSKMLKLIFHKVAEGEQDAGALAVWQTKLDDANLNYSAARTRAVVAAEESAQCQGRYNEATQAVGAAQALVDAANAAADTAQAAAQTAALERVRTAR